MLLLNLHNDPHYWTASVGWGFNCNIDRAESFTKDNKKNAVYRSRDLRLLKMGLTSFILSLRKVLSNFCWRFGYIVIN